MSSIKPNRNHDMTSDDMVTKRIFELLFITSIIYACMTILYITGVIS